MKELDSTTIESSEMVEQTFKFWFEGSAHIRSPFPGYIHAELKNIAVEQFFKWASGLKEEAKDEVNDEAIGEKFEEIIFETALGLVITEDEKITINYPFLPRIDDEITDPDNKDLESSFVTDRAMVSEGDHNFVKVKLVKSVSKEKWETKFELPA